MTGCTIGLSANFQLPTRLAGLQVVFTCGRLTGCKQFAGWILWELIGIESNAPFN